MGVPEEFLEGLEISSYEENSEIPKFSVSTKHKESNEWFNKIEIGKNHISVPKNYCITNYDD